MELWNFSWCKSFGQNLWLLMVIQKLAMLLLMTTQNTPSVKQILLTHNPQIHAFINPVLAMTFPYALAIEGWHSNKELCNFVHIFSPAQIFCNKEELLECSSQEGNLFCEQDLKQSFQSAKEGNCIEEEMRALNSVKKGNVWNWLTCDFSPMQKPCSYFCCWFWVTFSTWIFVLLPLRFVKALPGRNK